MLPAVIFNMIVLVIIDVAVLVISIFSFFVIGPYGLAVLLGGILIFGKKCALMYTHTYVHTYTHK
jgi:hypothetical protein